MKFYTDIQQSKKLAEILPRESADMFYFKKSWRNGEYAINIGNSKELQEGFEANYIEYIPAWSLGALLDVLPTLDGRNANFCKDIYHNQWHVYYHSTATLPMEDSERYDNIVDACYEMIVLLHKENLI
jgi:hypothetical protein